MCRMWQLGMRWGYALKSGRKYIVNSRARKLCQQKSVDLPNISVLRNELPEVRSHGFLAHIGIPVNRDLCCLI